MADQETSFFDSALGWVKDLGQKDTLNYTNKALDFLGDAYSDYTKTKSMGEIAAVEQRIAEINEQRRLMQANQALAQSNNQIAQLTQKYAARKSKHRVSAAARGVAVGHGSSKEVLATEELYKQIDVNTAYANGLYAALGYMTRATANKMIAEAHRTDVSYAEDKGFLG